jgi:hypothetical protein
VNFVSRWVVGERRALEPGDLDDAGTVTRRAIEQWVGITCSAYLAKCSTLAREEWAASMGASIPDTAVTGAPTHVTVSAGATELLPDAVVVAVRLRFTGGADDQVLNARCEVRFSGADGAAEALGGDVRDELIALEHAATFTN